MELWKGFAPHGVVMSSLIETLRVRIWHSQKLDSGAVTRHPRRRATAQYYDECLARILQTWPLLPSLNAASITPQQCLDWQSRLARQYAPDTVNGCVMVLRALFAAALRTGLIYRNPADELTRLAPRVRRVTLPTTEQWADAVVVMHVHAALAHKHRQALAQVFLAEWLAETGMRPRAALALVVNDVDFCARLVRLDGEHAKNREDAVLPLTRAALRVARDAANGRPGGERLFQCKGCRSALLLAGRKLKMPLAPSTLRKYFATRLLAAGVSAPLAAKCLTHHDNGQTLLKHYGQWELETVRGAVERLDPAPATR